VPKAGHQESPFHEILQNRTEGASALFYLFAESAAGQTEEVVLAGLEACRNTFPLMAVWKQALVQYRQGEHTLGYIADQFRNQTQDTVNLGSAALAEFQVILTLSNSSIVRKAIVSAASSPKVLCAESLPGGEGAQQVKALLETGIQATMVKDDDLHESMQQVQAIALGADQWDLSQFINKVGSEKLVKYAEHNGIPVFVLAEGFKQGDPIPSADSSGSQLEHLTTGATTQETLFETVAWRPHVRLVTNSEIQIPSAL
jgi:translation initiation factor 2B subunit (eIF-2B alpha/beta/delta family)